MKDEITFATNSVEDTMALGRAIGRVAEDGLFLALSGDLGAGKTHFVQGLAEGLGITGVVASPTFNIMNYYDAPLPLKHFDFYRLESEDDLYNIGWDEYSEGGVTVAEWADKFPGLIPAETLWLTFRVLPGTKRDITVRWSASAPQTVIKEIEAYAAGH